MIDFIYEQYLMDKAVSEHKHFISKKAEAIIDQADRISKRTNKPITVNDILKQKESK